MKHISSRSLISYLSFALAFVISNAEASPCPPYYTGFVPHPNDCSQFYECTNGFSRVHFCNPGYIFSPSSLVCDWPYRVPECQVSQSAPPIQSPWNINQNQVPVQQSGNNNQNQGSIPSSQNINQIQSLSGETDDC